MDVLSLTNLAPRLSACSAVSGPHVVGGDHGAEAACGADGLQPGDPDPEDQDVGGLGGPGGRRQHREVAPVGVRGDQDGLVAAGVRLRGQRVHGLGPGQGARDGVQADRGDAGGGQRLHQGRIEERGQQADHGLAAAQPRGLLGRRLLDAQDDVGARVQVGGAHDRGPGVRERLVRDQGTGARAGLDENLTPGSRQLAERFGHQGDAPLSVRSLPGDADLHGHHRPLGALNVDVAMVPEGRDNQRLRPGGAPVRGWSGASLAP